MKKHLILSTVLFLAGSFMLSAQGIKHTAWKSYYGDPLNDTIVLHILNDSSFATGSRGDTLVLSHATISKDTLTISDISGMYPCLESDGVYRFEIKDNQLHLMLVRDGCEGRAVIANMEWTRVPDEKNKKGK
jgi:hypothetical protein